MSVSRSASESLGVMALAVLLSVGPPASAEAEEAPRASSSVHRMAQGRFFLERGLVAQALGEFEAASFTEDGQGSAEVHELIAKTRYQLGLIGGAVEAAKMAAALSPRMSPEFAEFHEFLTTRFGKVLVVGASSEDALRPEPASPLLDPELKRAFKAARAAMDEMADGSTSVYLPVGSYRVGEHIVEVEALGVTRMDLRPAVDASGSGVYGERRGEVEAPRRLAPAVDGALLVLLGGGGYAQQGAAGGLGRFHAGAELAVAALRLDATVGLVGWRAERLLGSDGAPPAFGVEARFGAALGLPAGRARVGPRFGGVVGGSWPVEGGLPTAYVGPRAYLVYGAEAGLRVASAAERGPRPLVTVSGTVRECLPMGASLSAVDEKPHLSAGVLVDLGVRL